MTLGSRTEAEAKDVFISPPGASVGIALETRGGSRHGTTCIQAIDDLNFGSFAFAYDPSAFMSPVFFRESFYPRFRELFSCYEDCYGPDSRSSSYWW